MHFQVANLLILNHSKLKMFTIYTKGFLIRYSCVQIMKYVSLLLFIGVLSTIGFAQPKGDEFIEMIGQPASNIHTQAILREIGNGQYKESYSPSAESYTIESFTKGIALEFNKNFILSEIRFYDSGYLYQACQYTLPLYHKLRIHISYFEERFRNYDVDSSNKFLYHGRFENGKAKVYFKDRHAELIVLRANDFYLKTADTRSFKDWGYRVIPDGVCVKGDCREGLNTMYWPQTGLNLSAEWEFGTPHGAGQFYDTTGLKYDGGFKLGFLWGKGKLTIPNNYEYDGDFILGKRNGKGECSFNNGGRYQGKWLNDQMHGVGTFWYSERYFYTGEFTRNEITGKGKLVTPEGTISGEFKKGKPHGRAEQYVNTSQTQLIGNWTNGKKQGKFTYISPIFGQREMYFKDDQEIPAPK